MGCFTAARVANAMLACCVSWQLAHGDGIDVFGHDSNLLEPQVANDFDDLVARQEDPAIKGPLQEIQRMVGLSSVKESMLLFMSRLTVDPERKKHQLRPLGGNCMHMRFLGNPGTGKTVVARIVGKLLVGMGLIRPKVAGTEESNNEDEVIFKEVSRSDLVAQYKGQTAPKVRAAVRSAFGGVLFIDEAYSLAKEGTKDFGKEAIDTLIKEMEDNREHVVVILAGYDKEMEQLFSSNVGFNSRVPHTFHFNDYSCSQLVTIGEAFLNSKNVHLGFVEPEVPKVKDPLDFVCDAHPELESCWWLRETAKFSTNCCEDINEPTCRTSRNNGNGRTVRNILEAALRRTASRVMLDYGWEDLEKFDSELDESAPIECSESSADLRCHFLQLTGTDVAKVAAFYMQQSHDDKCGGDNLEIDSDNLMKMQPEDISSAMSLFRRLKWGGASCADVASAFQKTSLLDLASQSNSGHILHGTLAPCETCMSILKAFPPNFGKLGIPEQRKFWKERKQICKGDATCTNLIVRLEQKESMLGNSYQIHNDVKRKETCMRIGIDCSKTVRQPLPQQQQLIANKKPTQENQHRNVDKVNQVKKKQTVAQKPRPNGQINVGDLGFSNRELELSKKKSITKTKTTADKLMDKLDNDYVGLKPVKVAVRELKSTIEFDTWRKRWFGPKSSLLGQSFHMQFLGNPGTGKTVVARHVGKILFHLGVISAPGDPAVPSADTGDSEAPRGKFKFKEVSRADMVGQYVGATAKKVNNAVKSALGGVLFIDEAYSLKKGGKDEFGQEAVDELIKDMENKRANVIVVLAGYTNEMKSFIESNPGFKSRVPLQFNFDDYTCDELMDIGKRQLEKKDIQMAQGTEEALKQAFRTSTGCCEAGSDCAPWRDNGNGRTVRNVLEGAYRFMASRILVNHPVEVGQLKRIGKEVSSGIGEAKTQYCKDKRKLPHDPINKCVLRTTPELLLQEGYLKSPCKKHKQQCSVLSNLEAPDVMNVLQESVYLNLHRLCSPGEGETPEYNLADLKILVRVLPALDERELTQVLRTEDCFKGTGLLKRKLADLNWPQREKDALLADPPSLDFKESCDKECCEVNEVFEDIKKLIGLDKVKNTMQELYSLVQYSQLRNALFLAPTSEQSFHMRFVGNPGTGKTVVARLVGELLLEMGAVRKDSAEAWASNRCKNKQPKNLAMQQQEINQMKKKGEAKADIIFIEASRADLVAGHSGQTAPRVINTVKQALGGVLFIDEAYSLVRHGVGDSFGLEAVDTLIKEMEDKRAQVVVILAGYEKEMDSFFASNPGFKSRVPFTFHFDDYTCADLVKIGELQLAESDLQLAQNEEQNFKGLIRFASGCCEDNNCRKNRENGNGRTVRNVVDSVVMQQTFRLSMVSDMSSLSNDDFMTLNLDDLQQATEWLTADVLGRACSPTGRIATVTDALLKGDVKTYLDGSDDDLKPITNTINKIVLARSALKGLIEGSSTVFEDCEERMQAVTGAFQAVVNNLCGPEGQIIAFHQTIESDGKYSEELMQKIEDQNSQAEALTMSLVGLRKSGTGNLLGQSFVDGSLVKTCKSSMKRLVGDNFNNVSVGELLAWGQRQL